MVSTAQPQTEQLILIFSVHERAAFKVSMNECTMHMLLNYFNSIIIVDEVVGDNEMNFFVFFCDHAHELESN